MTGPLALTARDVLPHVNATLNGIAACLLIMGFVMVRRGRIETHRRLMLSAFACSAVFLGSYVLHKVLRGGTTHFREDLGLIRQIYLVILVSHFILAMVVVPLAITTIVLALRGKLHAHRRVARWTLPIWLYVSVTGVIVYLMLYQIWPP